MAWLQDCTSAGDALRVVDQRNCVRGDFVLVSGDVVSNMRLDSALAAHRARRKEDKQVGRREPLNACPRGAVSRLGLFRDRLGRRAMFPLDSLTADVKSLSQAVE